MTINFSSVVIQTACMALDEGTKRVRINVRASLTKEVRDKMDWPEPARENDHRTIEDAAKALKLEGEIAAANVILTPNEKELKRNAIDIHVESIKDFQLVAVKDGEARRRELRFQLIGVAPGILGVVEGYADTVGMGKAGMKVSCLTQDELPLKGEEGA